MTVDRFDGEYAWLSNFYPCEVILEDDGHHYPTVEHAYQAAKTLDPDERARIRECARPGEAKKLGRYVTMRLRWDDVKVPVMRNLLMQKFSRPDLRHKLLGTGYRNLVEGNTWGDTFWGVCRGKGCNMLGRLLMQTRQMFKEDDEVPF
jgi:ribA/ribD-fused uncharacterized protein